MSRQDLKRRGLRLLLVLAGALALLVVALELTEQEATGDAAAGESEPAVVEPLGGTGRSSVTLSASAAERLGVRTEPVEVAADRGRRKVVPYSALLYDEHGRTWVYTSTKRLTYLRAPVTVAAVRGDVAVLSAGPRAGTPVATVGAAELYGTELGVDH